MFDVNAKRITSPLYNLIVYLNNFEEDKLDNPHLTFLMKNMPTNLKKLIYSVALINKLQKDFQFIQKYNSTEAVSSQMIEYCFYKVSTIWDLSYQIADTILKLPKPNRKNNENKYDVLSEKFKAYGSTLKNLDFKWYENFNSIRNKIVHGGITINPFYINDDNIKNRICFQAYDSELNDFTEPNLYYSNIYNNRINYADNFFAYYTHLLYSYLLDFFEFILLEATKEKNIDIKNMQINNDFMGQFERSHKTWLLSDIDIFTEITNDMILLNYSNGNIFAKKQLDSIDSNILLNDAYAKFPFSMMQNIHDGDWKIV